MSGRHRLAEPATDDTPTDQFFRLPSLEPPTERLWSWFGYENADTEPCWPPVDPDHDTY